MADPSSLLYVGAVCFLATLGLDRLANRAADRDGGEAGDGGDDGSVAGPDATPSEA